MRCYCFILIVASAIISSSIMDFIVGNRLVPKFFLTSETFFALSFLSFYFVTMILLWKAFAARLKPEYVDKNGVFSVRKRC